MSSDLSTVFEPILQLRGVRGAMIVSAADGVVVAAALMEDVDGDAFAALTASLVTRLGSLTELAGQGAPRCVQLHAEQGAVFLATGPADLLLVVLAGTGTPVGQARLQVLQAAGQLA
jgi:predicted regulator of Ras-like GTPase activity (Roadblock/LC7/MglB family)